MTGIPAQSPAKGLGPCKPGLDPGEEWAEGGVRFRGPGPWRGEGPERQTERSVWLRQRNAKDPKGKSSVPSGFASGTRKTRKANRAFRLASPAERERPERQTERSVWLRQRNAKEKAPPRSGDKALPPCATCAAEGRTIRSRNLGYYGPLVCSAMELVGTGLGTLRRPLGPASHRRVHQWAISLHEPRHHRYTRTLPSMPATRKAHPSLPEASRA